MVYMGWRVSRRRGDDPGVGQTQQQAQERGHRLSAQAMGQRENPISSASLTNTCFCNLSLPHTPTGRNTHCPNK